ncbi:2-dehydropantoate 2-reductase [Lacrimispora sp. NSJ-141]|uniref:2-dehydropantoate 2-reductase n=1 Tax=Lientehia hominis TaxID=2897778 RepID=A0AAP2WA54_9FIRM|nr:2-dehydropantoate 2-reductase [Lientehia hominis]MCD2492807.1 2-dehydropantoate 2-reductase [Lientehia hominis]
MERKIRELRYLVIGAGGTGGCIAGYLAKGGRDVAVIARGAHLEAIRRNGLKIIRPDRVLTISVQAEEEKEYKEKADVIFVCVKGYSLDSTYELIKKAAHEDTVVIPLLNIYGTGERMSERLPGIRVLNGCIYIAGSIERPGVLRQSGEIFRIIYGSVDGGTENPVCRQAEVDLRACGIEAVYSDDVRRDTFKKYSFVSAMAAVGAFYGSNAGDAKREGAVRSMFVSCVKEIEALAEAMGIDFGEDMAEANLKILHGLADDCTASMQKDLEKGGQTEMDGLVFEVVRLGNKYHVPVPDYLRIAEKFKFHLEDGRAVQTK